MYVLEMYAAALSIAPTCTSDISLHQNEFTHCHHLIHVQSDKEVHRSRVEKESGPRRRQSNAGTRPKDWCARNKKKTEETKEERNKNRERS